MDSRPTTTNSSKTTRPTVCARNSLEIVGHNHHLQPHFLLQGSLVNSTSAALEEYVDILSVQQLLLDTPTSSAGGLGHSGGSSAGVSKPRPRLNVQKAVEYSGNHSVGELNYTSPLLHSPVGVLLHVDLVC